MDIVTFRKTYMDPETDLPYIDPMILPCGHWASAKHVELLQLQYTKPLCPVITDHILCERPLIHTSPVTDEVNAHIITFVNEHPNDFEGNYESVKKRSDALYAERITQAKQPHVVNNAGAPRHSHVQKTSYCSDIATKVVCIGIILLGVWYAS